jgi:hypothetical protein
MHLLFSTLYWRSARWAVLEVIQEVLLPFLLQRMNRWEAWTARVFLKRQRGLERQGEGAVRTTRAAAAYKSWTRRYSPMCESLATTRLAPAPQAMPPWTETLAAVARPPL